MSIIVPIISIIVLVVVNVLLSYQGDRFYWIYEISHFMGGLVLAILFLNFLDVGWVLSAVLASGVLWEIYELVVTKNKKIKKYLENKLKYYITPPTLPDTLLDLLLVLGGAVFYLYLF